MKKVPVKKIGEKVKPKPLVSIITPAYNVAEFIGDTLNGVFAQTFENFEVIVVNDGSPDTVELEKSLVPYFEKIIYIRQENGGASVARNTAIENACGEYLAFLDGDDIWFPEYLELQLKAIEEKKCDLIYCDALLFGEALKDSKKFSDSASSSGKVSTENLIDSTCNVITSGTVVKREKVLQAGMFAVDLPRIGMEDFDLWFRLAKNGAVLDYQNKLLLKYRVRNNSLSGSNIQRAERNVKALEVIESKYVLSEIEKASMARQMKSAKAELHLEHAKYALIEENFVEAEKYFREANKFYRKPKLSVLTLLLTINPKFVKIIFKRIRPTEYSFISPEKADVKR